MILTAQMKKESKFNLKEVFVSALKSLIQKNNLIDICLLQKMLRFFYVEDRTSKRHISIGVFVAYIDTGSSVPGVRSKSRDLAYENNKILTEWK